MSFNPGIKGGYSAYGLAELREQNKKLRLRNRKLSAHFELSPVGYHSLDDKGIILDVNPAWEKLLGYSEESIVGQPFKDFVAADYLETFHESFHEFIDKGWVQGSELVLLKSDGSPICVMVSGRIEKDETKGEVRTHCFLQDISHLKDTECALLASEQRYFDLFENSPDMYVNVDMQTEAIIDCNLKTVENLGYRRTELLGMPIYDIYADECKALRESMYETFKATGEVRDVECRLKTKSGGFIDVSMNVSAVRDATGTIVQSRTVWRDITTFKRAERLQQVVVEILHLTNENLELEETVRRITRILKSYSGCDAIGIRLKAGEDYPYYVTQGFDEGFIARENYLCTDNAVVDARQREGCGKPSPECLCGLVLTGGISRLDAQDGRRSFVSNCMSRLSADELGVSSDVVLRNYCGYQGYESVALVPIEGDGVTMGLLQFNDRMQGKFDLAQMEHFEVIADIVAKIIGYAYSKQALLESRERYRMVLQGAGLGTWDWDLSTDRFIVNARWAQMLGHSLTELDQSIECLKSRIHPDDLTKVENVLDLHIKGEIKQYETEYRLRHKSGDWVWVLDKGKVMTFDHDNVPLRMAGTHLDITERKRIEEHFRQSQMMAAQMEAIQKTTATYAHEINNPLTGIQAIIQLLQECPGNDESTIILLNDALDAAKRIVNVVEKMQQLTEIKYRSYLEKNQIIDLRDHAPAGNGHKAKKL